MRKEGEPRFTAQLGNIFSRAYLHETGLEYRTREVFLDLVELFGNPALFPNAQINGLMRRLRPRIYSTSVALAFDSGHLLLRPSCDYDQSHWRLVLPRDFYRFAKDNPAEQWGGVVNASARILTLSDPAVGGYFSGAVKDQAETIDEETEAEFLHTLGGLIQFRPTLYQTTLLDRYPQDSS